MANVQEIFDRIQQTKKEQRELRASYREVLQGSKSYQDTISELRTLKEKKKKIEQSFKAEFQTEMDKLERIKIDLESDREMMSDLAFNQLIKGEKFKIKDVYDNEYEPVFSVKFKKI